MRVPVLRSRGENLPVLSRFAMIEDELAA